ncbi:MAG TPA: Crp/Fnr family transcriptional regulator [Devosia sp.]|nr:Crp/Fnr family transcriptional regulator [Devosia sp.]
MNTTIDRALVQKLPLFVRAGDAGTEDILAAAVSRRYAAGARVFDQGQAADQFFILLYGCLRVSQTTSTGQPIIVRIVNPGELFGIAKALRRTDYPGTATAVSESIALAWPMAAWDGLFERHAALAVTVMQTIGGQLQQAHARMRELATENVERRVAHTVLRLVSQLGKPEAGGMRIDFPVSKQDIAELSGTTLHTVSRVLTAWEGQGLVQGGRQKLLVRDTARLQQISDGTL